MVRCVSGLIFIVEMVDKKRGVLLCFFVCCVIRLISSGSVLVCMDFFLVC